MALTVYLCRIGGYWLAGRISLGQHTRAWLGYLPGCIMIAIVVPLFKQATPFEWLGAVVTIVLMMKIDNLLIAMIGGMLIVALLRLSGLSV